MEILSYLVHILFQKRQFHINTDFAVTRWMLCVIPHISKDAKYNLDSDHWKQVNDEIIKLIHGLSVDKMDFTPVLFCTEYTAFDNKNG